MPLEKKRLPVLGTTALVLATATAVVSPLTLGAVHAPVLAAHAAIAHLALLLHVIDRWRDGRSVRMGWLGLPFALGFVFHLIYLLPLPEAVRLFLSPVGAENVLFVTSALSDDAKTFVRPVLSLDPPWTALSALRLSAALCVFIVVSAHAQSKTKRALAFRVAAGATAALVLVAVGHRLFLVPKIYGLWGAGKTLAPLYAPLINPNHLARCFGALGLLCIGRALALRGGTERMWFAVIGSAACVSMFLTKSTGAALALIAAAVALGAYAAVERSGRYAPVEPRAGRSSRARVAGFVALSIAVIVSVALTAAALDGADPSTPVWQRSKLAVYAPALGLLTDYWRVGVGPGGFQFALAGRLQPGELWGDVAVSHVENGMLQLIVDYGVPLVVMALVLFGWLLARNARSLRPSTALYPLGAVVFLVVGDFFDFSLELSFGVFLAAIALGLAAAGLPDGSSVAARAPRALLGVGALLGISVVLSLLAVGGSRARLDAEIASAPATSRAAVVARALALHPADSHYAYLLTRSSRLQGDARDSLNWASRTLHLRPAHPGAHLEAARALWVTGHRDQALLEYRLAHLSGSAAAWEEVAQRTTSLADLLRVAGDASTTKLIGLCKEVLRRKRLRDALDCFDAVGASGGREALVTSVELALRLGDSGAASARLQKALAHQPRDGRLAAAAAQVLALDEGATGALVESGIWVQQGLKNPVPLQKWRLQAALGHNNGAEAERIMKHLRGLPLSGPDRLRVSRGEVQLQLLQGNTAQAFVLLKSLAERRPREPHYSRDAARLALKLGAFRDAERLALLSVKAGGGKKAQDVLNEAREKLGSSEPSPRAAGRAHLRADDVLPSTDVPQDASGVDD